MKRFVSVSAAVLVAGLAASSALAKGVSEATITGPGLGDGITLPGEGQPDGGGLFAIVEAAGFYAGVFVQVPTPMLADRPRGELGPQYTIAYTMPGPSGEVDTLRQELYPYAQPEPVTYVEPGQSFFGTEETVGGWYVAGTVLRDALVAVGLPETPPADGGGGSGPWPIAGLVAVVCLAAVGAVVLLGRRRPGPAPAA